MVSQLAAAERTVRAREPLRLSRPADQLQQDFQRFTELRDELARAEPRVLALRDAAQLLKDDGEDVCRRLNELRLRLKSLRKLSGVYALKLGAALARAPGGAPHTHVIMAAAASSSAQLLEEPEPALPLDDGVVPSSEHEAAALGGVRRGLRFVLRVARASLPFQALLLLLLGAAALAPLSPSDCRAGPSLSPVLRFPHGPPPM
ncbi:unnamed protein product [Danaus chrysippus]|uniref:(African queen) hypothetical protein n=1 Tax=Danaus chrysippus TaxID=151541 RepID=A0A8J2REG3_9NEOP|nr:unnamed protein product [Danaus chrysippus]